MLRESKRTSISLPVLSLMIYFILMPLDILNIAGLGSVLKLWGIVVMFMFFISAKSFNLKIDKTIALVFIYLFVCLLSFIYTINVTSTKENFISLALNFLFFLVVAYWRDYSEKEKEYLNYSLVLSGIIMVVLTLIFSGGDGRLTVEIGGFHQNQNYIVGYIIFLFGYALNNLFYKKRKILNLIIVGLLLIFTLYTGSRGGLLAEIVLFLVAFILLLKKSSKNIIIIFSMIIIVILFVVFFDNILLLLPKEIADRFAIDFLVQNGTTGRIDIWKDLLTQYKEGDFFVHLFGFGFSTSIELSATNNVAHNVFIDVLVGNGIVGLIVYILLIIQFIKLAIKSKNYLYLSILFSFICMMMSLSIMIFKPLFNCFIMIAIVANRKKEQTMRGVWILEALSIGKNAL